MRILDEPVLLVEGPRVHLGHSASTHLEKPLSLKAIGSIFRLRRELVEIVKAAVLGGYRLTVQEADLLIVLYRVRSLGDPDPPSYEGGWVTSANLLAALDHGEAALSRRIGDLDTLVERSKVYQLPQIKRSAARGEDQPEIDKKTAAVRITEEGIGRVRPVYERYCQFCESLLKDFPPDELTHLIRLNEAIVKRIRWG